MQRDAKYRREAFWGFASCEWLLDVDADELSTACTDLGSR